MNNHLKTVVLLSALTAVFLLIGQSLGGKSGFMIALAMAAVMNLGAYWFSDKIVLKMHRAREITPTAMPDVYSLVARLAAAEKMPMPKVYFIPEMTPNAFATGRNPEHAAVAVTEGLLELLDSRELEGVLSHELAHIKNRDTLVSSIAATLAGALSMLADMAMWGSLFGGRGDDRQAPHPLAGLIGIILAPLAGMLIQAAISRSREYLADESGARTTGDPLALANALHKIETFVKRVPMRNPNPSAAHLYIVNPLRGRELASLFSTHPPTKDRVRRLEAMSSRQVGIDI